ncbi:MAG: Phenolic acid decarboxylase subunit C [Pelotomaculum sp. PtaB.Bin104]|nr:MAG: Phenolic acid decarboxylase subunit C [Pelotomaculum sp. PtaB.Bin104]
MGKYHADLREYIAMLEREGKLNRVTRAINKDTELMPIVRWQYKGLTESERKAWLFENVVDSTGKKYDSSVAVALLGGSREIYAMALNTTPDKIDEQWNKALLNPIPPVIVESGPVHEEVKYVENFNQENGGLYELPIPISTPGFDCAPYLTSPYWVTKDPETGITNIGTYRGMIKAADRTGIMTHQAQHIGIHLQKAKAMGMKTLPAAVVLGCVPVVGMCSVAKIPYGVDEYAVAGGLAGEPIPLVKCKTVDIEVPATSEIVLEGEIPVDILEQEAPFGEYTGYMGPRALNHFFNVKCITNRRKAVYQAFISQCPPSESSKIRQISYEAVMYKFLKYDCNIPSILKVAFHESSGSWEYMVIQMKKTNPSQPWQALNAAVALDPTIGKFIIAVDEDIDPLDPDSVNWALSFRVQPHLDCRITTGKSSMLDPSSAPPGASTNEDRFPAPVGTSAILIDATRPFAFPAVSLPAKEYMEHAKNIWEELGLPKLTPKAPWHGYTLGYWSKENEEEARLAVQGKHYLTGNKLASTRVQMQDLETKALSDGK